MGTRGRILLVGVGERLVTETCYSCGVLFAMVEDFYDHRQSDRKNFYCPNGHAQHYVGKTDAQKLQEAEAREVALKDQLGAAIRDAEQARVQLLRDRQRYANGVCPCCNRYFPNVHRHMTTQHPEVDAAAVRKRPAFKCSCGQRFDTFRGLRTHQGHQRRTSGPFQWDKPGQSVYWSHLTAV